MKVSIGTKIKEGPWGGGNLFAKNLKNYLLSNGHEVTFDLDDDELDIILITEPRKTSESSAYSHEDVRKYLRYVNPSSLVVHRINECDERKNTNHVNKYLKHANKIADSTVFVSNWIKNLYIDQNINSRNINVIMAGSDENIFNREGHKQWDKTSKLKLVTHHWGANWNKGFDIYLKLDDLLMEEKWNRYFEFTYIGNLPKNFNFRNVNVIKPTSGLDLAKKIKQNHIYITGSINEPSGNHHIEGAQCGLPILYLNSGGTPEYCKDFGIEISLKNLDSKLLEIKNNYEKYQENMINYPFNSDKTNNEYLRLFEKLIHDKEKIFNDRDDKNYYGTLLEKNFYLLNRKRRIGNKNK